MSDPASTSDVTWVGVRDLCAYLGVSKQRVSEMIKQGMSDFHVVKGKRRFNREACRMWQSRHLSPLHGGTRAGSGSKRRDGSEPAAVAAPIRAPDAGPSVEEMLRDAGGELTASAIMEMARHASARQAATIRQMVSAAIQAHELEVRQRKYVLVSDVEAAWKRLVQDAVSLMDDASKRSADLVASRLKVGAAERAAIQSTMAGELGRVRDTLAGGNA